MRKVWVLGLVVLGLLVAGFSVSAASEAWIPAVASFAIPGLGQLLNDQPDKAITHFVIGVGILALNASLTWIWVPNTSFLVTTNYILWAANLAWRAYSAWDAYKVAKDKGFSIGFVPNGIGVGYTYSF